MSNPVPPESTLHRYIGATGCTGAESCDHEDCRLNVGFGVKGTVIIYDRHDEIIVDPSQGELRHLIGLLKTAERLYRDGKVYEASPNGGHV